MTSEPQPRMKNKPLKSDLESESDSVGADIPPALIMQSAAE